MKKFLFALSLFAAVAVQAQQVAHASELDNEDQVKNAQRMAKDLPQTLVVRKAADGSVAVMHSKEALTVGAKIDDSKFVNMLNTDRMKGGELDNDSSTSGWYFYWYNYSYSYPTYYYYNYSYYYRPYYNYYYNNCWYYWYSWGWNW